MPQLPTSEHRQHLLDIPLVHFVNGAGPFRQPFLASLYLQRVPLVTLPLSMFLVGVGHRIRFLLMDEV